MNEYEDLDAYNGDAVHDMNVDFDYFENTGEPDYFEDDNPDECVNYLKERE